MSHETTAPSILRPLVEDLHARRARARLGGGEEKVARQHEQGKLTARERIDLLVEPGTFTELGVQAGIHYSVRGLEGKEAPADGVVTGYGKVDGRLVAVAAYDFTVMAGSMGMTGETKVARLRELALTKRMPMVWLLDSAGRADPGGGRLAVRRLGPPLPRGGRRLRRDPAGRRAHGPVRRRHRLHPRAGRLRADGQGPRVDGAGRAAPRARGGRRGRHAGGARRLARAHAASRASATSRSPTTTRACRRSRTTCRSCPPTTASRRPGRPTADPVDRGDEELLDVLPESNRKPYDMYDVIRRIVDDGDCFDLKPQWAKTIITCLARFGGRPAGIVANQPRQLGGILDNDSADKAARFVNLCNAFGIPLVFLVGRAGVHGRHEGRGGRHHPPRREDAPRGRQRHRPEGHDRPAQGLRRRLLRHERPRLRARPHRGLADAPRSA